jgi:hypothetical protein
MNLNKELKTSSHLPLSGFYFISEVIIEIKIRTGSELTLRDIFRYAGDMPLYLKMRKSIDSLYYLNPSHMVLEPKPDFTLKSGPFLIRDDQFISDVVDALSFYGADKLESLVPKEISPPNQYYTFMFEEFSSPEDIVNSLGDFENRFRIKGEDIDSFISDKLPANNLNLNDAQYTDKDDAKLSTQGENSYRRSARALAQALIGTFSDKPSKSDIKQLATILLENGVEDPQSEKTWIKHLTNPD